jgi:signal transduction histidine kinase
VVIEAQPLVIRDARRDPLVQSNPAVSGFGVIAYLGVPLTTPEGHVLGSLCAIDTKPREWPEGAVEILGSLAAMVMAEIELRSVGRELRAANLRLQTMAAERDELVHMLVHDLRNPLHSIVLAMGMMEMRGVEAKHQQTLTLAKASGERLLRMIGDILEVNKAEAGKMQLHLEEVAPGELVARVHEQLAHLALSAEVTLEAALAPDLPLIAADGEKLRRVLVNLVANAIQHSPPQAMVRTSAQMTEASDAILFSVEDQGCGIAPELADQVFEKFGTVKARKEGVASTGLGLVFCKKVVDAHGGKIGVRSHPSHGSTFWLTTPLSIKVGSRD